MIGPLYLAYVYRMVGATLIKKRFAPLTLEEQQRMILVALLVLECPDIKTEVDIQISEYGHAVAHSWTLWVDAVKESNAKSLAGSQATIDDLFTRHKQGT